MLSPCNIVRLLGGKGAGLGCAWASPDVSGAGGTAARTVEHGVTVTTGDAITLEAALEPCPTLGGSPHRFAPAMTIGKRGDGSPRGETAFSFGGPASL